MSKSQSLAVVADNSIVDSYPALQPGSDVALAIEANMMAGERIEVQDLTRVKTPAGGATTWTWDALTGEESAKEIEGILVYMCMRGVLWPSNEPTAMHPVLVSDDLMTARRVGDDMGDIDPEELERCNLGDGTYDWLRLSYNQFGSGKNGIGKRCKESRMMFLLRAGEAWPTVVSAGPGSLKTIRPFIKKLPVPHFRAIVSLGLKKTQNKGGQDYAQIVPRYVGDIGKDAGAVIRKLYTEPLRAVSSQVAARFEDGE